MATVSSPLLWVSSWAGVQSPALTVVAVELVSLVLLPQAATSRARAAARTMVTGSLHRTEHRGATILNPERLVRPMTRSQKALTAFFTTTGVLHFVIPRSYEAMMPPSLPAHREAVIVSGLAEIVGGRGRPPAPRPPLRPLVAARPARRGLPGQRPHGGQPRAGQGPGPRKGPPLGALGAAAAAAAGDALGLARD